MRPRTELVVDQAKEAGRALQRTMFDQDDWEKLRRARLYTAITTIPQSRVLSAVAWPAAVITSISVLTCMLTLAPVPSWLLARDVWAAQQGSSMVPELATPFLSLLLLFKFNNAAARFHEGQRLCTTMLTYTRDVTRAAIGLFPPEEAHNLAVFARWAMVYTIALRCHVRGEGDLEEGAAPLLTAAELALLMSASNRVRASVCMRAVL